MKKNVILPILLLSASAVFGMEEKLPWPENFLPRTLNQPINPVLAGLKDRLDDLRQMQQDVLGSSVTLGTFLTTCDQLQTAATSAKYQKIASQASKIKVQTMRRLQ